MKLSDLLVPSTKFSKFRCDTYKKFSAQPGILYPVWYNLLNPGESASLDLRSVIRTWPVESPLMGSMKVRFVTAAFNLKNYAMALEGYHRNFDWRSVVLPHLKFEYPVNPTPEDYYYTKTIDNIEGVVVNLGYIYGVGQSSLADYLGYPNGWLPTVTNYPSSASESASKLSIRKSFIPFLCYYDFYRNYLVNPQESTFPMFTTSYEVDKEYLVPDVTLVQKVLKKKSIVYNRQLSALDDLISSIHKYYDGSSSATNAVNQSSSTAYTAFQNLFSWRVAPSNFNLNYTSGSVGNTFSSEHGGLVATMFDSDINTQWMNIDNYSKLNDVTINTQTVSGSTFTSFVDIVKASSLWDFVTKSVNSDGTYGDFIGNQFGVAVKGDMNIPQIVHVYDTLLTFDDITSQSTTEGSVLGQQAGVGRSYGQSNHFKVVNKDGNYVMLMTFMWVTPQICYSDGLFHLNNIVSFSDLYQPSFDNYAMQARLQESVNASLPGSHISQEVDPTFLYSGVERGCFAPHIAPIIQSGALKSDAVIGYQPAWSDYKTDLDVVHGLFRRELDYYTIIRDTPYITNSSALGINTVLSSYVYSPLSYEVYCDARDAKRYSLPFAIQEDEDCMQVQLRVSCTMTRAMSKNVNPNIK